MRAHAEAQFPRTKRLAVGFPCYAGSSSSSPNDLPLLFRWSGFFYQRVLRRQLFLCNPRPRFRRSRDTCLSLDSSLIVRLALTVSVRVLNSLGRWYRSSIFDRSVPFDDRGSQPGRESKDEIVARWLEPCIIASTGTDARGVTTTMEADCIILRWFLHSAVSYTAPSISFSYRSLADPNLSPLQWQLVRKRT